MALGSTALLLKTGRLGSTKDVDAHPFPVGEDVERYFDVLQKVAAALDGNIRLSEDGATTTLWIRVRGPMVPVELIEGGDEFVTPEVLPRPVKQPLWAGIHKYLP